MRSFSFLLLFVLGGCSSTTHEAGPPTPSAPVAEPADAGDAGCGDGTPCTFAPASLQFDSFAFHSVSVAANGFKRELDVTLPSTPLSKLPYFTDELVVSIDAQSRSAFSLSILHVKAKGADGVPEIVSFAAADLPRKVGAFTLKVPKDYAWLSSSLAPSLDYEVACHTTKAEVLSESEDRRVYHVKISGGCDWARTIGGSTDTTSETLSTELTLTLMP